MRKILNSILTIVFCLSILSFHSCSNDEDFEREKKKENIHGRFDNTPFVWDEIYSLNDSPDQIYIGDLSVVVGDDPIITKSRGSGRPSGRPGSGGRPGGSDDSSDSESTDKISVVSPPGIYVGAAYPKSSLPYTFDKEITKPRNPVDLIFDFSLPFFAEVTKETGSVGYKKALKDAITSSDYKTHIGSDKESVSYSMTQFSSYTDLEKGFSNNTKFASLFTAQVKINRSKVQTKINGQLFARLTSNNFNVYMDTPPEATGFFKDPLANKAPGRGQEASVYIRSITYGKVVYVAIESEYSYSDVKFALEVSIKYGPFGSSTSVNERVTEIFNKSAITIFAISDNSTDSYFVDGMKNLDILFKAKYTAQSYGFPIFIQGRYIHDNSAYIPSGSSGGRDNGPSRPSNGGGSSRPSRPGGRS